MHSFFLFRGRSVPMKIRACLAIQTILSIFLGAEYLETDDTKKCITEESNATCSSVPCNVRAYENACLLPKISSYRNLNRIQCCFACCVQYWFKLSDDVINFRLDMAYITDSLPRPLLQQRVTTKIESKYEHIPRPDIRFVQNIQDGVMWLKAASPQRLTIVLLGNYSVVDLDSLKHIFEHSNLIDIFVGASEKNIFPYSTMAKHRRLRLFPAEFEQATGISERKFGNQGRSLIACFELDAEKNKQTVFGGVACKPVQGTRLKDIVRASAPEYRFVSVVGSKCEHRFYYPTRQ